MKRALSILLALFLVSSTAAAFAEGYSRDERHTQWLRAGMTLTARMIANALDSVNAERSPSQASHARAISGLNFLSPEKAVVLEMTREQADTVCGALGVARGADIVPAFGDALNLSFSEAYAQLARELSAEADWGYITADGFALVLLAYPTDISLVGIDDQGFSKSVFVISEPSVPEQIDEEYMRGYARSLGLSGVDFTIYDAERFDALMNIVNGTERDYNDQWHDNSDVTGEMLTEIVTGSAARMRALLPLFIGCDYFYTESSISNMLGSYIRGQWDGQSLESVRFVATECNAMIDRAYGDDWRFMNANEEGRVELSEMPVLSDEPGGLAVKADAAYLLILTSEKPDEEPEHIYDLIIESAFPLAAIPASVQEADYIIHGVTTWVNPYVTNNITVYDAQTVMTLHDARTGELVRELGSVVSKATGYIVVFSDTYYPSPDQQKVLDLINQNLF